MCVAAVSATEDMTCPEPESRVRMRICAGRGVSYRRILGDVSVGMSGCTGRGLLRLVWHCIITHGAMYHSDSMR